MKKLGIAFAALTALTGSAFAADVSAPAHKAPAMASARAWTGCYIGGGGGYGLYSAETQAVAAGAPVGGAVDQGGRGWFGTVQAGCDYQAMDRFVVGAFGDYDWSGIRGNHTSGDFGGVGLVSGRMSLQSSWAVGGRIGYLVNPSLLTYFSGGYTEAQFSGVVFPGAALPGNTYSGHFVGGGVEYNLGWLPGLFWKTEYRLAEYDTKTMSIANGVATGESFKPVVQTVRTEIVWRPDWRGPAGSAFAADLPTKAPKAKPASAVSWTGCYLGGGGGYGLYSAETQAVAAGAPVGGSVDQSGRGWFGTVQAGCDYQAMDRFVIGGFGDVDWSGIHGNHTSGDFGGVGLLSGKMTLENSWAAGGRGGYIVNPSLLTYVSGGYTEARFSAVTFPGVAASLPDSTYPGYFVGGGVEYNLGWLPGLFWKTEYRLAQYDTRTMPIANGVAAAESFKPVVQTVRSELVWRLGSR